LLTLTIFTQKKKEVNMSKLLREVIIGVEKAAKGIYRMTVASAHISSNAVPGQFVNIKCCDGTQALLRRPVSICSVDRAEGKFDLYFQVKGTGTEMLARKKSGEFLDIIGPLGNGFDLDIAHRRIAVVGGGIGIFPLLFLLNESKAVVKRSYLGFRSSEQILLLEEFRQRSTSLETATEDGSFGTKGFVTDLLERDILSEEFDMIYACGPYPMLRKVSEIAEKHGIRCQVSMEQRMGCGFGACLTCACKTYADDGTSHYVRVCSDGPVFNSKEVVFE